VTINNVGNVFWGTQCIALETTDNLPCIYITHRMQAITTYRLTQGTIIIIKNTPTVMS